MPQSRAPLSSTVASRITEDLFLLSEHDDGDGSGAVATGTGAYDGGPAVEPRRRTKRIGLSSSLSSSSSALGRGS